MPPSSALAAPTPMNQVPRVIMKDGTLRLTWTTPLTNPTAAPTRSTSNTARMPRLLEFAPLRTSIDRMTALSARMPSTERSIEPINMMNVAPTPRTSGIIADCAIRTKFPALRKFGLINVMSAHNRTSTTTGAQVAKRHRIWRGEGRMRAFASLAETCRVIGLTAPFPVRTGNRLRANSDPQTPTLGARLQRPTPLRHFAIS